MVKTMAPNSSRPAPPGRVAGGGDDGFGAQGGGDPAGQLVAAAPVPAEHRDRVAQRLVDADHGGIVVLLVSSGAISRTVAPTARKLTTASHCSTPGAVPRPRALVAAGARIGFRPVEPLRGGCPLRSTLTRPIIAGPRGRRRVLGGQAVLPPGSGRGGRPELDASAW